MLFTTSLKQNHIFRRLFARGDCAVGKTVVVYSRKNGTDKNRIGFSTGVKLGHAVVRNRVRRRLREVYRRNEALFQPGYDLVVVARGRSVNAAFGLLQEDFLRQCRELGLLKEAGCP